MEWQPVAALDNEAQCRSEEQRGRRSEEASSNPDRESSENSKANSSDEAERKRQETLARIKAYHDAYEELWLSDRTHPLTGKRLSPEELQRIIHNENQRR
jgi:hypothetical protein